MRIARKSPLGLKAGDIFLVHEMDFYNDPGEEELAIDAARASAPPGTKSRSPRELKVTEQELGFAQVKREWIYLISEKQTGPGPEENSPCKKLRLKGG
jgi:hypothetical protein